MAFPVPEDIPIESLPVGEEVKLTDVYVAVDTTDLTESPTGTTKQYTVDQLQAFIQANLLPMVMVSTLAQQMAVNTRYITNNAGQVNLTLPQTFNDNDIIEIANINGGFIINQNANQNIIFGNLVTATGVAGRISSSVKGDGLRLVGVIANTTFIILPAPQGNLTIV